MTAPVITMACQAYDRMQALRHGTVRVGGARLNFLDLPVEETFFRMLRHREFDVAELSLSSYVLTLAQGAPFVAVPVFPSRAFRHSGIYVRADSPVEDPVDLAPTLPGREADSEAAQVRLAIPLVRMGGASLSALPQIGDLERRCGLLFGGRLRVRRDGKRHRQRDRGDSGGGSDGLAGAGLHVVLLRSS